MFFADGIIRANETKEGPSTNQMGEEALKKERYQD